MKGFLKVLPIILPIILEQLVHIADKFIAPKSEKLEYASDQALEAASSLLTKASDGDLTLQEKELFLKEHEADLRQSWRNVADYFFEIGTKAFLKEKDKKRDG